MTNFFTSASYSVNHQYSAFLTNHPRLLSSRPMPAKASTRPPVRSSAAVEDYLERILELIQSKGYARVVDIAASLKISQASVTNMVQRLDADGLLKYEKYRGLVLTPAGARVARKIAYRHRLLTDFFRALGVDEQVIHHDV